jgi:hypothetical protein
MFGKAAAAAAPTFEEEDKTRIVDGASALAGALSSALATEEPPSSALAGAFSEAVGEPSSALSGELGAPADEWYVGINGVPVGPIRLSELRSKAGAGAVSYDSLVWRDGFEEWQPLRTFPELVAIVEESLSSARASLTPQIPQATTSAPISVQMPGSIPITVASPGISNGGGVVAPVTGPAVVTEAPEVYDEIPGVRRRASSAAAWIAVVVALLFGLTAGFVLFSSKKPSEPIVKYVEVPAKDQPSASPAAPAPSAEALPESTIPGVKQTGGRGPAVAGTAKPPEKKEGLSGLQGLEGLKGLGPASGGPAGEATRTAGQPLDGATVQRTVGRYTSSVRRSCWQPALDTRAKDAPTSARVNVTITVGAGGNVQNVSTSGEPRGYRGLAGCIASRVRGWTFPASSGTTTVNVPFVFAAQ